MEEIDINKFLKLSKKKKNEFLYESVKNLCKEICEIKNIEFNENITYTTIEIYYNSIYFSNIRSFYYIDIENVLNNAKRYKNDELKTIIFHYNDYVKKIKKYKEFENKIQKEGFFNLESKYKENLRNLLIKMLDFKKRKYDKNSTLIDLIDEIELCYYDYDYIWTPLYQLLNGKCIYRDTVRDEFWVINADDVEYLDILNKIYNFFSEDENSYKNYNQFYEDITLKDNETIEDIYNAEKEKLKKIFIEMLKYKNIEIEDDNYNYIEEQVFENYKQFQERLIHYEAVVRVDVHSSYIDMITEIKRLYKFLKENYKN